jgi:NTE family protein
VSNLRRRELIGAFTDSESPRPGTYWGIQSDLSKYPATPKLACDFRKTQAIANIETRLTALSDRDQDRIINWGYAVCDAALRSHLPKFSTAAPPTKFPYAVGVET